MFQQISLTNYCIDISKQVNLCSLVIDRIFFFFFFQLSKMVQKYFVHAGSIVSSARKMWRFCQYAKIIPIGWANLLNFLYRPLRNITFQPPMSYSSICTSPIIMGWRVRLWVLDRLFVCVTYNKRKPFGYI